VLLLLLICNCGSTRISRDQSLPLLEEGGGGRGGSGRLVVQRLRVGGVALAGFFDRHAAVKVEVGEFLLELLQECLVSIDYRVNRLLLSEQLVEVTHVLLRT
jgi:hypothetical protein